MWSETLGYRQYREPYLPRFFEKAARKLALTGGEALIDLACGTGDVAFGFSRHVRSLTGVDIEQPMIEAAGAAAKARDIDIRLIRSAVEELPADLGPFDLVTIGKAHMWLKAEAAIERIDRVLARDGRIFICFTATLGAGSPWYAAYRRVRRRWAPNYPFQRLAEPPQEFLRRSPFRPVSTVKVMASHRVAVEDLVKRAFGYEATSRKAIGEGRERFAAELRSALLPYARDGAVRETFQNYGVIFERRS
jgi:SAM-dependent methyltransferase